MWSYFLVPVTTRAAAAEFWTIAAAVVAVRRRCHTANCCSSQDDCWQTRVWASLLLLWSAMIRLVNADRPDITLCQRVDRLMSQTILFMTLSIVERRTSSDTNFHTCYFYFILFYAYCVLNISAPLHVHGCTQWRRLHGAQVARAPHF